MGCNSGVSTASVALHRRVKLTHLVPPVIFEDRRKPSNQELTFESADQKTALVQQVVNHLEKRKKEEEEKKRKEVKNVS